MHKRSVPSCPSLTDSITNPLIFLCGITRLTLLRIQSRDDDSVPSCRQRTDRLAVSHPAPLTAYISTKASLKSLQVDSLWSIVCLCPEEECSFIVYMSRCLFHAFVPPVKSVKPSMQDGGLTCLSHTYLILSQLNNPLLAINLMLPRNVVMRHAHSTPLH